MIEKINELLKDFDGRQSNFQNRYFVLEKQHNKYAQYIQALRELSSRVDTLRSEHFALERHLVDIEEIEYKLQTAEGFDKKRLEIDLREKMFSTEPMRKSVDKLSEDISLFYNSALLLKPDGDEKQLEQEMWESKVKWNIFIDWKMSGNLSKSSYEFLASLPKDSRDKIVEELKDADKFMLEMEEEENNEIDFEKIEKLKIDKKEIKKLL